MATTIEENSTPLPLRVFKDYTEKLGNDQCHGH